MKCKALICCLFGVSSLHVFSANILWDVVAIQDYENPIVSLVTSSGGVNFWTMFSVEVAVMGSEAKLTANPGGDYVMAFNGGWIKGEAGDIVSRETLLNRTDYFVAGVLGQEEVEELPLEVNIGENNFLRFIVQDAEQCFAYQEGLRSEMPDCYYGWAEYNVGQDGVLSIVRSALNVDGDAIVVGGGVVPEPSSGLLLLMGVGLLAMRRGVG